MIKNKNHLRVLFNDGLAVMVFVTILKLAKSGTVLNTNSILMLLIEEAIDWLS
jgi:CPA1 family monovalent cation:H+ antiporter